MSTSLRDALEAAGRFITEHPEEAKYSDSLVTARLGEALHVTVEGPNGERTETDMPTGIGGKGAAPSPGWLLRAAIASCVASLAGMRAAQLGLEGFKASVEVDSESDDRGILGLDPNVPAGALSVRIRVRANADGASGDTIRELAEWAVEHCPSSEALSRVIPVNVEIG